MGRWPANMALAWALMTAVPAHAHFQEMIPSPPIVTETTGSTVALALTFTHPFEQGPVMAMGKPVRFGVRSGNTDRDLSGLLTAAPIDGQPAYQANFSVLGPGGYVFYLEPAPYWEPAEGRWLIHYTKVVVDAYGSGEDWDQLVGMPAELRPLTRPYGLWTGNLFQAVVLQDGRPVPFAEIEVEYRNQNRTVTAPSDPFITQVVRADANGTFGYVLPRAGWWGFAALLEGAPRPGPDGRPAPVEAGALIWVHAVDMGP